MYNLILDSGAFSAWTKKAEVNIDQYAEFILQHIDYISYVVNLDVIPGEWGRIPTVKESELSCQKGFENYYYLLEKGVPKEKLIHVFHQGDSFKWLQKMMKECTDYIGISPANDKTTSQKMKWLDEVYGDYICDCEGISKIRTHGFGVTAPELLLRYPWYSVDSATWVLQAAFGSCLIPIYSEENGCDFSKVPLSVTFSLENKSKRAFNYNYNLSGYVKKMVDNYLNFIGLCPEKLKEFREYRCSCNLLYFKGLQEYVTSNPPIFKKPVNRIRRFL